MNIAQKIFCASCLALLVVACAEKNSPEERVRSVLANAETLAEARDSGALMDLVAADYSDARGFDREQLRQFLRGYFLMNQRVNLLVRVESVEFPAPQLARVRLSVGSVNQQGEPDDWALAANVRRLAVELVADGEAWLVRRADLLDR
jgi:hypothetical protein